MGLGTTLLTAYFVLPALLEVFDRGKHLGEEAAEA
jgi:hypothetical protein